jgi:hypothetical protein
LEGWQGRVGMGLAGLVLLLAWPGLAAAQVPSAPTPSPIKEVTDKVQETVDQVDEELEEQTKSIGEDSQKGASLPIEEASRTIKNATRTVENATRALTNASRHLGDQERGAGQELSQPKADEKARGESQPGTKGKDSRRSNRTSQKSSGNREGDVDRLVDAGNEIEANEVQPLPDDEEPRGRQESLPLTGFQPHAFILMGLMMMVVGALMLAASGPPRHPVPG